MLTGKYAMMVGLPFPIVGVGAIAGLDPKYKTIGN